MTPMPKDEQVRQAGSFATAQAQVQNPAIAALLADAERANAERHRLVHHIHELTRHVHALEHTVNGLLACAVQQRWDGRLRLPSPERVKLDAIMNGMPVVLELRVSPMLESPTHSALPQSHGAGATAPLPAPAPPTGQSVQSLAGMAGSQSWQSIAAANGVENPRNLPPGRLIDL
jgi:hypothetical protein